MSKNKSEPHEVPKETGRIEAFSDGVIGIALTLLVLEIRVPRDLPQGVSLASALLNQWPSYMAFLTSFTTVGLMWINHHNMFKYIRRVDNPLLILNTILLMGISLVPFQTALLAEYLQKPEAQTAAIVYGGMFTVIGFLFFLFWRYASRHLLVPDITPHTLRIINRRNGLVGSILGLLTALLALINAHLSLLIYIIGVLFYGWLLLGRPSEGEQS